MDVAEPERDAVVALLLCSERSGSNLLRCMLDAHPRVYAPNTMALGLLCAEYDGNKQGHGSEDWNATLDEVERRVNASTFYTGVRVERNELAARVEVNDTGGLYLYAYYRGMRQRGADCLVIKEHQAWRIADYFLGQFPKAKILVQVRDPRDHAVSCKKLGRLYTAYHGSVARAARMWSIDQQGALQLKANYGADKVWVHCYEDLVMCPRETLEGICRFLQLDWQESMLNFHIGQAALKRKAKGYLHNMWANLDCPVMAGSVSQWKEKLTPFELITVEREVGSLLTVFGYEGSLQNETSVSHLTYYLYRICAAAWYAIITTYIWLAWLIVTQNPSVPIDVVLGNTVRAHLPYEHFRDRLGYRL